jgi:uncharacterized protein (DUF1015 family)
VADIRPFPALRPRPDLVEKVASPPYDVLSSDEARQMVAGNPHSFLRVVKAEVDLDPSVDVHSDAVYDKSAANFRALLDEGVLIRDPEPCFYVYRLSMDGHVQHGLVVGASVDEYESGAIKKHELTRRAKEDDRARHVEKLMANAGPVLFTYRAQAAISGRISTLCKAEPACDFLAADGVGHTVWRIDAPEEVEWLVEAFRGVDGLYVADGHHRSASAFRVRNIMRERNPKHSGQEAYNHFLAVLFPDDELQILGYHRVVRDLNELSPETFWKKVGEKFDVEPCERCEPATPRTFTCFLDGAWHRLSARPGSFPEGDPVRSLDAAILQDNLLTPVLGIVDIRADERIDFVGGIRGMQELERRCGQDMRVAFALHPVGVQQLMTIADSGAIMPPKSTWFEPKLRSGVVVRSLED